MSTAAAMANLTGPEGLVEVLRGHREITDCVVDERRVIGGRAERIAFVVCTRPGTAAQLDLRAWLSRQVAATAMPDRIVELLDLPRDASGHVEVGSLPLPPAGNTDALKLRAADVERVINDIWKETLTVPSIMPEDDFLALGGNPELAANVMFRVRKLFGEDIRIDMISEQHSLRSVATAVHEHMTKKGTELHLVPIRVTGSRPPLICVAPPNTRAVVHLPLAQRLPPDQPVYAVQIATAETGTSWTFTQRSYEKLAELFLERILDVIPQGPYHFIGQCEGAHVAFEMARQLEAMGRPLGTVVILDTWPLENTIDKRRFVVAKYGNALRRRFKRLSGKFLPRRPAKQKPAHTMNDPSSAGTPGKSYLEFRYWPGPDFRPATYSGKVVLFRTAKQQFHRIRDRKLAWGQRALGGVEVIPAPGFHDYLLREPAVNYVARELELRLRPSQSLTV